MPQINRSCEITFCAGYIVPSCKGLDNSILETSVKGSDVSIDTIPNDFFIPLFSKPPDKYPIDIVFKPEDGLQTNAIRTMIRNIVFGEIDEKKHNARELAFFLSKSSDRRSPTGLFIIMTGIVKNVSRILLWKFPADETLQAILSRTGISILLLQDAFSRKSNYFKAAIFEGSPAEDSFWRGKVEDRQAKYMVKEASEFWIHHFLNATSALTDIRGTKILAKAIKNTIKNLEPVQEKAAIIDTISTIKIQTNRNISIREFANRYIADNARDMFIKSAGGKLIADAIFKIDPSVLDKELRIKTIIFDNLFVIKGPLEEFDNVVKISSPSEEGIVEVCLRGVIKSELVEK